MSQETLNLIDRLLAKDSISSDLRVELQEFRVAAEAGSLDGADRGYVAALAQRLLGVERAANDDGEALSPADDLWDDEDQETKAWRLRAEKAEARVAELEAELAKLKG